MEIRKEAKKVDVIYVRVSSKEQVLGFSLDSQEKVCKEFSERSGHAVLRIFREEGESAKTADRTELQKMMLFCEKNKKQIGRIVVYKVDRFSRLVSDYSALRAWFHKLGISIASATEPLDDTPAGRLSENMLSAFAQFDNDVRSQRTVEGMRARLLKGLWSGSAPWGYMNTVDESGSKIIAPHPEKALVVEMLFKKYVTGKYTFKELARMANKVGVTSRHGMIMSKQLVAKIIANPIYYGMVVVPKFEIALTGLHEPIITRQLFEEAKDVRNGIVGRKAPRNKDNQDYPLRGIRCAGCGGSISGGKTKGKTKYYEYYGCINSGCSKRTAIKRVDMEDAFTKFLRELTPNEDYFAVLKEAIAIAHKNELQSATNTERKFKATLIELKDRKAKLLELRIEGKISDDDFIPANEKYKLKIVELENEMNKLSVPELELDRVVDTSIAFLKSLPETWKKLDVKDLRVLRPLLFPQNLEYTYPKIKTPELCPIYNVKAVTGSEKNCLVTHISDNWNPIVLNLRLWLCFTMENAVVCHTSVS